MTYNNNKMNNALHRDIKKVNENYRHCEMCDCVNREFNLPVDEPTLANGIKWYHHMGFNKDCECAKKVRNNVIDELKKHLDTVVGREMPRHYVVCILNMYDAKMAVTHVIAHSDDDLTTALACYGLMTSVCVCIKTMSRENTEKFMPEGVTIERSENGTCNIKYDTSDDRDIAAATIALNRIPKH